jgi:hypothetical protein
VLPEWDYSYASINQPQSVIDTAYPVIGTLCQPNVVTTRFDSVLTVLQVDSSNLLSMKYYVEKYAANIGLVYREIIDVSDIKQDDLFVPWSQRDSIAGTLKYELRINSHN